MRRILTIIFIISFLTSLYADEINGKLYLLKGKEKFDKRQFNEAVNYLNKAIDMFPLLADYALLWLSDVYHEKGNHKESLETVRKLISEFPDSPLIKKARIREIKEAQELNELNIEELFKSYIKDYPKENAIKYLYALWLKENNMPAKAKNIFKEIYISAGDLSDVAYHEISSSDLTNREVLERATNLIKNMEYKNAETLLKGLLDKEDGRLKKEILNKLGYSLFKQKRYIEASDVYKKADERYWEFRSLYRAGQKEIILKELNNMFDMGDKRMGSILLAVGSDMRRDGRFDEAIALFKKIKDRFSDDKEEADWNIGWTYYQKGEYDKASAIFNDLYDRYNDVKYLYWYARSLEESGSKAEEIYNKIVETNNNLYAFLANIKNNNLQNALAKKSSISVDYNFNSFNKSESKYLNYLLRVDTLLELNLKKEAVDEILFVSKKINSYYDILYLISKLQEVGEYKHSIRIATKLPFTDNIIRFLYPVAYMDMIEKVSQNNRLDPFIVLSVIREESRFDPWAKSPAGALGLMQLMPETAFKVNKGFRNSYDILNIKNNISSGVRLLGYLQKEFGSYTCAIAAYNAGEDNVKKWLKNRSYKSIDEFIEDIPFQETRNYVKKVLSSYFIYRSINKDFEGYSNITFEKL